MSSIDLEVKLNDLNERYTELSKKHEAVKAVYQSKKSDLSLVTDEIKKLGFDPDELEDDIKKLEEVIRIKIVNFETEISEAERIIGPMFQEISK